MARIRSFTSVNHRVCWVYTLASVYGSQAISHEVGHTLGLRHDNDGSGFGYHQGHGSGVTSWCPIMGSSGSRQVYQWSKGEFKGGHQQ